MTAICGVSTIFTLVSLERLAMFMAAFRGRSFSTATRLGLPLICGVVLTTGCAQKPKGMPDLAPVTGTVTMDGQPLAKASIAFVSQSGGQVSFAGTDGAGKYELRYSGRYKGAMIGENTVQISTASENPVGPEWKDPIPAKYNKKTELKADVKQGTNTFDFDLKSK
jgi:hypothetical protein